MKRTECERCGTCCEKGGAALHRDDFELVRSGVLGFDDLVTIRVGEIVLLPESGRPEATEVELIKIQGRAGDWCCRFLHPTERSCTIYENRPLSCRLLKCWEPEDVIAITGQKLVSRYDLVDEDDPLLPLIRMYDQQFPLPDMIEIKASIASDSAQRDSTLSGLELMAQKDILFRSLAVERYAIPVSRELFYFGRPLFQLLLPLGIEVAETEEGLSFHVPAV